MMVKVNPRLTAIDQSWRVTSINWNSSEDSGRHVPRRATEGKPDAFLYTEASYTVGKE